MTDHSEGSGRTGIAVAKVLYLFAITATAFAVPASEISRPARWIVVSILLAVQVLILWRCGVGLREVLRSVRRLKWLFLVLLACYAFLPGNDRRGEDDWHLIGVPFSERVVELNLGGMAHAALMCVQILTIILASAVVRLTGPGTDLVDGLRVLRLPTLFVHTLDQTLGLLGGLSRQGQGRGDGTGGGGYQDKTLKDGTTVSPGAIAILRQVMKGDVGFFTREIRSSMSRAQDRVQGESTGRLDERLAHDVAIITGVAMVMVSLKMLKILPGVPFFPGFKTILFYPLYILAARQSHTHWGGTCAGAVMGVIGFLQGDGRFGVLEILKHLAPGLLIDLLMPVARRLPESVFVYCALGFLAAVARTTTEFVVVLLLDARAEVYLFPAARLIPNLIAGTLSGFVTVFVLRAFDGRSPDSPDLSSLTIKSHPVAEPAASLPMAENVAGSAKEVQ